MKRIIYVAKDSKIDGDSFDIKVSFDKEEATDAAIKDRRHQSDYDRRRSTHSVEGYEIDVTIGESAEECWGIYLDCGDYKDPVYYEEINVD